MKKTISVSVALIKNWMRNKGGVFFAFVFPFLLLLIFGTVFGGAMSSSYSIGVQDRDRSPFSEQFIKALENTGALDVENVSLSENVEEKIERNETLSPGRILIIPEGFQEVFYENDATVELKFFTSDEGQTSQTVRSVINSVVGAFNNEIENSRKPVRVKSDSSLPEEKSEGIYYYLPGLIAAFIMTNGLIQVTTNVSEFRRNGIMKRMSASSLKKHSWIAGNLIHQVLLAFGLTLMMIGAAYLFFQVLVIPDILSLVLALLGAVTFCGMGIVLGGVIKNVETATAAGNAIAFPMMFLSGAFWPLEMVPGFMQAIAKALPVYYLHRGLRETLIYENPSGALLPLALFAVLAVVFLALAVWVTRWKEE